MTNTVERLVVATVAFFWAFLMWFSTAAFSPSVGTSFGLPTAQLALLASSATWLAPPPFILFFLWAMRYEHAPAEHGLGTRARWLGAAGTSVGDSGGDDW